MIPSGMFRAPILVVALATLVVAPLALAAQPLPFEADRPWEHWRTIELEHLVVHYPLAAEGWVLPLVERMEAIEEEVTRSVGHRPPNRATVVVTDPSNQVGGFAFSALDRPFTLLWPTPPPAGSGFEGEWSVILFAHEYVHLAHLTRPSRNPGRNLLGRLLPARIGPLSLATPRWIREGFATQLEGELTGLGRPHGAVRPAFLRVRALEGRLPSYGELSGASGFQDWESAYLAGSAFLEWLVEREGDESLDHLWRRLSAHERRSFEAGFVGVFGDPPAELYGRFQVELTARALEARALLEEAGLREGELVLRRRWHTGAPTVSPDGSLIAFELHAPGELPRIVVHETAPDEEALERMAEARDRLLERDSLDVPAVDRGPAPLRRVATLDPPGSLPFVRPRFLPDGERILLVRWEPLGDGTLLPDLHLWEHATGRTERLTRGSGIRSAAPSPDGRRAVGVRCEWGSCDLVIVELADGSMSLLARGSPTRQWDHAVWDGESVVAALQEEGRWRIARVHLDGTGQVERIDPDDGANRYSPTPLPDGSLVVVSERSGIAELERLDPLTGTVRPLTRVVGAVSSPAVGADGNLVHFLHLQSRGWDIRRIHADSVIAGDPVILPERLGPIARASPRTPPPTFDPRPLPEPVEYGWGPRTLRFFPTGGLDAAGASGGLALVRTDPAGRAVGVLQGAAGDREGWSGASARTALARFPVGIEAGLFHAEQREVGSFTAGVVALSRGLDLHDRSLGVRGGASWGRTSDSRVLGFATIEGQADLRLRGLRTIPALEANLSSGRTGEESWTRLRLDGSLLLGSGRPGTDASGVVLEAMYGRLDGRAGTETFRVGGRPDGLLDPAVVSHLVPNPALPPGLLEGRRVLVTRAGIRAGGLEPYIEFIDLAPLGEGRHRVVGLRQNASSPALPVLGIPGLDTTLGVSHSLDDPFAAKTRVWLSFGVRP